MWPLESEVCDISTESVSTNMN